MLILGTWKKNLINTIDLLNEMIKQIDDNTIDFCNSSKILGEKVSNINNTCGVLKNIEQNKRYLGE